MSYSEVKNFEMCAAYSQSTDIPGITPGHFVQYVADNVDHNVRTMDGFNTFNHRTCDTWDQVTRSSTRTSCNGKRCDIEGKDRYKLLQTIGQYHGRFFLQRKTTNRVCGSNAVFVSSEEISMAGQA